MRMGDSEGRGIKYYVCKAFQIQGKTENFLGQGNMVAPPACLHDRL